MRVEPLEARLINDQLPAGWDARVEASPQSQVYFGSAWIKSVHEAMCGRIACVVVLHGQQEKAGIVALRTGDSACSRLESHSLVPYAGPWLAAGARHGSPERESRTNAILRALESCIRSSFKSAQLDLHPDCLDVRTFVRAGWIAEPRYTYITDLSVDVERAATSAVRRRARRAAAGGVEFDPAVPPAEFIDLWHRTCERRRIAGFLDPATLGTLLDRVVEDGMGEILGTRLTTGRLAAANVILYDDSSAYFWLSGFDPGEPYRGASNQLCHLRTLGRAATRVDRFDWLGANTPGVAEYKASFGPRLVGHFRIRLPARTAHASPRPASAWRNWFKVRPLLRNS